MQRTEIIEKLKEVIAPYVQNQEAFENVSDDTDLMKDLNINSQHLVDIILDAEELFDIEIDDEAAEKMLTVGAAVDIVEHLVNA
jgi:acyl carrier protein